MLYFTTNNVNTFMMSFFAQVMLNFYFIIKPYGYKLATNAKNRYIFGILISYIQKQPQEVF